MGSLSSSDKSKKGSPYQSSSSYISSILTTAERMLGPELNEPNASRDTLPRSPTTFSSTPSLKSIPLHNSSPQLKSSKSKESISSSGKQTKKKKLIETEVGKDDEKYNKFVTL